MSDPHAQYMRNLHTLSRCQQAYDNMEPPEYWESPWDDEEEDEEVIDPEEDENER